MKIKSISLWQPWASAMAIGLKRNETRSWATKYRGPLAIHAAKTDNALTRESWQHITIQNQIISKHFNQLCGLNYDALPRGCIVAVGTLDEVVPTEIESKFIGLVEAELGNYEPGRFAWKFTNLRSLPTPIPARGAQGFFEVEIPDGLI